MDERTALQEKVRVITDPPRCSHCKIRGADLTIKAYRHYCRECWVEINQKKSNSMRAKNMKRSAITKAKMSASKRVKKSEDPAKWKLFYEFYLEQLLREEELAKRVGINASPASS